MGRPLNKKYFGNRNIGSTTVTTDNGIGGEGIASVTLDSLGSYTTRPTITFPAPTLPSGVTATGTITSEALSAVATAGGTGYVVGDLLTVTTAGGTAVFEVASLTGDGSTGEVATVTVSDAGSFTTLASGAQATTTDSVAGADATLTITYQAQAVVITKAGSGYVANSDLEVGDLTFTQSVTASAIGLTTDSGSAGSSTNQENAIVAYAFIPAADGGTAAVVGDLVKQTNDRRFKVKTAEGTGICQLKTSGAANAAGEMTIKATDQAGKTYYVYRITSRTAVLVPYGATGHQFPVNSDGTYQKVKWTFGSAVAPTTGETGVVTIENV